jgi:hypothetical protein
VSNNTTTCGWCEREEPGSLLSLPADGITTQTTLQTCSACTALLTEDDPEVMLTPVAESAEKGQSS